MTNWQIANLKDRLDERCVDGEGINVTREDVETLLAERELLLEAYLSFVNRTKELNVHYLTASELKARNAISRCMS